MSKFATAKQFINQIFGGAQKTTGTGAISSVDIGKNLTKKKNIKDELIAARDKQLAGVRDEAKVEIKSKNPLSKFTKKIENIVDKKAKGGRVGLKLGTNKVTFVPYRYNLNESFNGQNYNKRKNIEIY